MLAFRLCLFFGYLFLIKELYVQPLYEAAMVIEKVHPGDCLVLLWEVVRVHLKSCIACFFHALCLSLQPTREGGSKHGEKRKMGSA